VSPATAGRTCTSTGLHLIAAGGETAFRVAKDRYGALSVRPNSHVGPLPLGTDPSVGDRRGRFDTVGSTVYLGDSRRCAYAEVLIGFRKKRAAIANVAESIGWDVEEYIEQVISDARANGVDVPWAVSVDWQMERSIYQIRLPCNGWWVHIDHADTLAALESLAPAAPGLAARLQLLTAGDISGEDRALTTLLAHLIREQSLDDGSQPLGIAYASKTLMGRCWAYWDRRTDLGLPPGGDDLHQLASENVGPDAEFASVAAHYGLPLLRPRS
jgi:hypothetical protein